MRYHEFIDRVRERANLEGRDDAIRITRATLATLGEFIDKTERSNLAAQIPNELKEFLYAEKPPLEEAGRPIDKPDLEEFYTRVIARADLDRRDIEPQAKAVIETLQEAVSSGEIKDVLHDLPGDYAELFRNPAE
jgi:uncharacterized protein (DUF2267 family)